MKDYTPGEWATLGLTALFLLGMGVAAVRAGWRDVQQRKKAGTRRSPTRSE